MPEYGQPQRNAITDANAGIVNPPSQKLTQRVQATKQKKASELQLGIESFGEAFGKAAQNLVHTEAKNIREQKAMDAAIRQGTDHAVNTIDQNEKRTGAMELIFGQDAGYESAQRRAVENNVQAAYMEQAVQIDTYAGETDEEYADRLKGTLDGMLESSAHDKETRKAITLAWTTASSKLAAKHTEAHYAWNQLQNRETFAQRTRQNFDTLNIEANLASSPREYQGILVAAAKQFDGSDKPKEMSGAAWRSVKNEEVNNSLRNGNIGAYLSAKAAKWESNLAPAEKVKRNQALYAYDTDFGNKVGVLIEDAVIGSEQVASVGEARQYWETLVTRLDSLERRSSETDKADLILAKARSRAAREMKNLAKAGVKAEAKASRLARLKGILREKPAKQTSLISAERQSEGGKFSKEEIATALDSNALDDIRQYVGEEGLSDSETVLAMLRDPLVANRVAKSSRSASAIAPVIKEGAITFINGWDRMVDEEGRPTEEMTQYMASVSQFAADDEKFKNAVGDDNYKKWLLLQRGVAAGNSSEQIQKETDKFFENKGKVDKWKSRWPLQEDETHQQYITKQVSQMGAGYPRGDTLAYYMEEYQDGLQIYAGDHNAARNYLRTTIKNATIQRNGVVVRDGRRLNEMSDKYDFNTLMDGMESTDVDWMRGVIAQMVGDNTNEHGEPMTSLSELSDYELYTVPGFDGVFVNSQSAQRPVRIPAKVFKQVEDKLLEAEQFREKRYDVEADALMREWEEDISKSDPFALIGM